VAAFEWRRRQIAAELSDAIDGEPADTDSRSSRSDLVLACCAVSCWFIIPMILVGYWQRCTWSSRLDPPPHAGQP